MATALVAGAVASAGPAAADLGFINLTEGADAESLDPVISTDGSTVIFRSSATNIVPGRPFADQRLRAYVYSTLTGEIEAIDGDGVTAADLSSDGTMIAFSTVTSLDPADTGGEDVYLWNRTTNEYRWLTAGQPQLSLDRGLAISGDGGQVSFLGEPGVLIWESSTDSFRAVPSTWIPNTWDISDNGRTIAIAPVGPGVLIDLDTGQGEQLSPEISAGPKLSADGTTVVYRTAFLATAVWRDRPTGVTFRAPVAQFAMVADISPDGSTVVISTKTIDGIRISELFDHIVVWRPEDGDTTNVTLEANGSSRRASIAGDNETVVFETEATNLAPDSNGSIRDILINRSDLPPVVAKAPSTEPDTERPSVPGRVSIALQPGKSQVGLAWGQSTDNEAVAGYNVYLNGELTATVPHADAPAVFLDNLQPDTDYFAYVRAFDAAGNQSWRTGYRSFTTTAQDGIDNQRPGVPTSAPFFDPAAGMVRWGSATDDGGIALYRIYDANTGTILTEAPTNAALLPDGTYRIYIRAVDFSGNIGWRTAIRNLVVDNQVQELPDTERPSIPGAIQVLSISGASVELSWAPSTDNVEVVEYRVYEKANNQIIATTTDSSAVVELPEGVLDIYVRALDGSGNQSWRTGYRRVQ